MSNTKFFRIKFRALAVQALAVAAVLGLPGAAPAVASDTIKEGAKKTEQGFGNLLTGIGQEAKKVTTAVEKAVKTDEKKTSESKPDKSTETKK